MDMDEFLFLGSLMVKQTGIRLPCLFLGIYEKKLTTFQENYNTPRYRTPNRQFP